METDDPYPSAVLFESGILNPDLSSESNLYIFGTVGVLLVLIGFSALFSASENALFSLSPGDREDLKEQDTTSGNVVLKLLSQPRKLLATILVANNFVNVTFIIVSTIWIETILNPSINPYLDFAIKVILVTLLLLLFGEVVPKVYATRNNLTIARFVAFPLLVCQKLFAFIVYPMVKFTSVLDRKVRIHEHTVSADELAHAIDITSEDKAGAQDKEILKGIVSFGSKTVRQIMRGRMDVSAIESRTPFGEMVDTVKELGYSRFPVYEENFDNIQGILYIKEILPHLGKDDTFNWNALLKPAFFVPENKRIDLLLSEFQEERMHMAIVVDEYGGKLGIVTMEDILEEIFGEINDEFDEDQVNYSKLDEKKYILEGKMLINDFCRVSNTPDDFFDSVKGDTETMAGLVMEIAGKIPARNETITFRNFSFTIESVDVRRIKRIKVEIL